MFEKAMKCIQSKVIFIKESEGGRACMPYGTGYPPHLVVQGTEDYLAVRFIEMPTDVQQGQEFLATMQLMYPDQVDYSRLKKGTVFEIREGSRVVGSGIVEVAEYESRT